MGISRPVQEIFMKTVVYPNHRNRALLIAGSSAALALVAMGFAGAAHARDNLSISVGIGVPGVLIGATNAYPVYSQPRPVYVQPRPVYVQPAPVYYQPAPVYYAAPAPVYYQRPQGWKHGHYKKHHKHDRHDRDDDRRGSYQQPGYYNQGYAPVYYQR
jgi:hypothetical protein